MDAYNKQSLRKVSQQAGQSNNFAASVCPNDDGSGYTFYPLGFSPPQGQHLRIAFSASSPDAERLVIWAGNSAPDTPVSQVLAQNNTNLVEISNWPGGELWFTFQHCINGRWIDYRLTGFDEPGATNAAYNGRLDSLDPYHAGTPTSTARISWGPGEGPGSVVGDTPTYSVTFENIEILNTRSRDDDTDFASIGVTSPLQGKLGPLTRSLGDLDNGIHTVGLTIPNILIPKDNRQVNIVWTVLNSGHSNSEQTVNAIQTTVEQVLDEVFGKDSIISEIGSKILSLGLTFLFANCDGPVVGGNKTMTGVDVFAATSGGDYVFTLNHPGLESPTGCGSNSLYKSTVRIRRTAN